MLDTRISLDYFNGPDKDWSRRNPAHTSAIAAVNSSRFSSSHQALVCRASSGPVERGSCKATKSPGDLGSQVLEHDT